MIARNLGRRLTDRLAYTLSGVDKQTRAAERLREILQLSKEELHLAHYRVERRLGGVLFLLFMLEQITTQPWLMLFRETTWAHKIALLSGHPDLFVATFLLAAGLLLPRIATLALRPLSVYSRLFARLAVLGLSIGSLCFLYMGYLCSPLDGPAPGIYFVSALEITAFAFALALSLNHDLMRRSTGAAA